METLLKRKEVEEIIQEAERIGWPFGPPPFSSWAMPKEALIFFCCSLPRLDIPLRILELGAGQSTIFWYLLMKKNNLNLIVTSLEHDLIWIEKIREKLGDCSSLRIEHLDLKTINEEEWTKIFNNPKEAKNVWNSLGTKVPNEKFNDYSIHNAFYEIPAELFARIGTIDAMIVDGPHGNGRSLAFPLFYNQLNPHAVVLLDNVDHYNFLGNLLSLFNFRILTKKIEKGERWAVVALNRGVHIDPFGKIDWENFHACSEERWLKTFLGIPQGHTFWLYKVIDDILTENQEIRGIIEIGTYKGALSVFLGLECYERKLKPLLTFDIKKYDELPKLFELLKVDFLLQDCFSIESINRIKEYLDAPVLFICDGGNKNREFNQFASFLPKGSIIAVHDWPHEAWYAAIKNTVKQFGFVPIKIETWCAPPDYIFTSFWKKIS